MAFVSIFTLALRPAINGRVALQAAQARWPDLVFMDLSDWHKASSAALMIHSLYPKIAIIGFGAGWSDPIKGLCEHAGVTELLVSPVTIKE